MIKIYGASDDLVEIEGSNYKEDEIGCYERDVRIRFTDGTIIRIGYSKSNIAVWYIEVESQGTAKQILSVCIDEEADPYSDVFEIDAEINSHSLIKKRRLMREEKEIKRK